MLGGREARQVEGRFVGGGEDQNSHGRAGKSNQVDSDGEVGVKEE